LSTPQDMHLKWQPCILSSFLRKAGLK